MTRVLRVVVLGASDVDDEESLTQFGAELYEAARRFDASAALRVHFYDPTRTPPEAIGTDAIAAELRAQLEHEQKNARRNAS